MGLKIDYNDDGSVTVECGGQSVNIFPQGSRSPAPPPAPSSERESPPPISPRAFVRPQGIVEIGKLENFIPYSSNVEKDIERLIRNWGKGYSSGGKKLINIQLKPKHGVELEKILNLASGLPDAGEFDLQFWLTKIEPKDW